MFQVGFRKQEKKTPKYETNLVYFPSQYHFLRFISLFSPIYDDTPCLEIIVSPEAPPPHFPDPKLARFKEAFYGFRVIRFDDFDAR